MARVQSLTAAERETIITASDADPLVRIWTAQRSEITRMRKNRYHTQVATGYYGTTEWAEFTIPAERWSSTGVRYERSFTAAQRAEAASRLAGRRTPAADPTNVSS